MVAEARSCESRSSKFKGYCFLSKNCKKVCTTRESFTGGHCRGFIRRCQCTKVCYLFYSMASFLLISIYLFNE
ncbi:putative defensin, plant [Lupinus albus]|uniref:Putative defensin, plant n=1 Tax=Lupinus albus TaxID=3870 RepID=A0A6A4PDY6_LUPAL|nr:putative defensin, plant [Lupinus albus]